MDKKLELLAPAGSVERLKIALNYGADAVYIGGKRYGLRAYADNFDMKQMDEAVVYAHKMNRKVYVTLNIIAHNEDIDGMYDYIREISSTGVDALIVSDPGIIEIVKEAAPEMEMHLSTQASNTNYKSALFWYKQGLKRIILARELSFDEISEIRSKIPEDLTLEAFVHGAMCISYSGRCLLSNYLSGRDSNRGQCAQPCRWKYYLMEETRPNQYFPIEENSRGTFIFNSKDLMMIEHIPEMVDAGITSFKIEGRMKTVFYVATVVKAYRKAIDSYLENPDDYHFDKNLINEISSVSNREFTTGFYLGKPGPDAQIYKSSSYVRGSEFIAMVLDYDGEYAVLEQRNKFSVGDSLQILSPDFDPKTIKIDKIISANGEELMSAPHAQQIVKIPCSIKVKKYDMLRKAIE